MRNRWLTRILMLSLAVLVVLMGVQAYNLLVSQVRAVNAYLYTAEESFGVAGYLVRDEVLLLNDSDGYLEVLVSPGQRVARQETVAQVHDSPDGYVTGAQIRALESEIERLEFVLQKSTQYYDVTVMDAQIDEALLSLLSAADSGKLQKLSEDSLQLKSLVFKREYPFEESAGDLSARLASRKAELAALQENYLSGATPVRAELSGVFSNLADGYEFVLTPETVTNLQPSALRTLSNQRVAYPEGSLVGKQALGYTWYYWAVMDETHAGFLEEGRTTNLRFAADSAKLLQMKVQTIGAPEDGKCAVLLSSDRNLSDYINLRRTVADVIYKTYTGLRIPRAALRVNEDGQAGVYCEVAMQVQFKPVEILYEKDNYYIVKYDSESRTGLLMGDEVIVAGKDLYDGKTIR